MVVERENGSVVVHGRQVAEGIVLFCARLLEARQRRFGRHDVLAAVNFNVHLHFVRCTVGVQNLGIVQVSGVKVEALRHLVLGRIVHRSFPPDREGVSCHHRGRLAVNEALQRVCLGAGGRERRAFFPVERPHQDILVREVLDGVFGTGSAGERVTDGYLHGKRREVVFIVHLIATIRVVHAGREGQHGNQCDMLPGVTHFRHRHNRPGCRERHRPPGLSRAKWVPRRRAPCPRASGTAGP